MTAVFMPPTDPAAAHAVDVGLCCDRRGDPRLLLGANVSDLGEVARLWGSEAHWALRSRIRLSRCPRCTYQPHNQIFEQVILNDAMTFSFI